MNANRNFRQEMLVIKDIEKMNMCKQQGIDDELVSIKECLLGQVSAYEAMVGSYWKRS